MDRLIILCIIFHFTTIYSTKSTQVFDKCGTVVSGHQFLVQSRPEAQNSPCKFWIKSVEQCDSEFHLQFLEFGDNCSKTRLEIFNTTICGFKNGIKIYKSQNGGLLLNFVTEEKFKILITTLPCPAKALITTDILPNCCADSYSSRRFYLASPGFIGSSNSKECAYKIYRANPNICRLRIYFKYFWVGHLQNGVCYYGFLELDGQVICGCHSGVNIVSHFDQNWGDTPKVIRFQNDNQNGKGFVLEIVQDECPTKYTPNLDSNLTVLGKTEKVPEFYYYNDQLNKISFPTDNITKENMKYLKQNAELLNENTSNVTIDYYFFKAPEEASESSQNEKEPDVFDTTSPNFTLPHENNVAKCQNWGRDNWNALTQDVLWNKMKKCQKVEQNIPKCCDINLLSAYLVSPGYPNYYPGNLNLCYRFHKQNNYCSVKLSILDFDLENSHNCGKDSLILYDYYKYCGRSLMNNYLTFDLTTEKFEDLKFISDKYYCGRGFKIYFEYTPCEFTTPYVPPTSTTVAPMPNYLCGRQINTELFELTFLNKIEECLYFIHKSQEDVCGIQLLFIKFDLACGMEYLSINNKQYCGQKNGKNVFVTFDQSNTLITIKYQRRRDYRPVKSSIIVLRGQQIKGDCDPFILDVPAQRRLRVDPETIQDNTDI